MKITDFELQELMTVMEIKNLSISQVIEIIGNSNVQSEEIIDTASEIKLIVDYTKTLAQSITDGGYDWKNREITAKIFPISRKLIGKKVEITTKLFHFNSAINSDNAISKMDKDGYRPATLMELLALGALHPNLQRHFPIVALGSLWPNASNVHYGPYLGVDGNGRGIIIPWFVDVWGTRCRFLGVRK